MRSSWCSLVKRGDRGHPATSRLRTVRHDLLPGLAGHPPRPLRLRSTHLVGAVLDGCPHVLPRYDLGTHHLVVPVRDLLVRHSIGHLLEEGQALTRIVVTAEGGQSLTARRLAT